MIALSLYRPSVIGKIATLKGKCFIKRNSQSDYDPITINQEVNQGDLIKPDPNATVIIKFNHNNILWQVPAGIVSGVMNGCPPSQEIIESSSGKLFPPR